MFAAFAIVAALAVESHAQTGQNNSDLKLSEKLTAAIKTIVSRINYAFETFDNWLDQTIGFNFTKLIQLIGKIIVWFLNLLIKLVKWLIDLIV